MMGVCQKMVLEQANPLEGVHPTAAFTERANSAAHVIANLSSVIYSQLVEIRARILEPTWLGLTVW